TASLVCTRVFCGMRSFSPASWTKSRISTKWRSSAATRRLKRRGAIGLGTRLSIAPSRCSSERGSSARLRLHALPRFEHVPPRALVQGIEHEDLLPALERFLVVAGRERLHPADVELLDAGVELGARRREAALDPLLPGLRLLAPGVERDRLADRGLRVAVASLVERLGCGVHGRERVELPRERGRVVGALP